MILLIDYGLYSYHAFIMQHGLGKLERHPGTITRVGSTALVNKEKALDRGCRRYRSDKDLRNRRCLKDSEKIALVRSRTNTGFSHRHESLDRTLDQFKQPLRSSSFCIMVWLLSLTFGRAAQRIAIMRPTSAVQAIVLTGLGEAR